MAFKTDKQRKAFFAKQGGSRSDTFPRIQKLPSNLINPSYIPKGSKYAVTKSKGLGAFTDKPKYFKDKQRALKEAKRTRKPVFKL